MADLVCNNPLHPPEDLQWVLLVAFITAAVMSFGVGANDAANSWGTSVGSGAIALSQAMVVGGVMDWLGATTLGGGVSDTIRHGVIAGLTREDCWACGTCDTKMSAYMLGMAIALLAAGLFLFLSTLKTLPVSTTHAAVGAVVGMTITATSWHCLNLTALIRIAVTWVTSPVLSGVIGATTYLLLKRLIIMQPDADRRSLMAAPWLLSFATASMTALVVLKSSLTEMLHWIWVLVASVVAVLLTLIVSHIFLVPYIRQRMINAEIDEEVAQVELAAQVTAEAEAREDDLEDEAAHADAATDLVPIMSDSQRARANLLAKEAEEAENDEELWDAVVENTAVEPTPASLPGVFADEEYSDAQRKAIYVFRYLLVFVAALESFAHGANDTANAAGAFSAVYMTFYNGSSSCDFERTPVWILMAAGLFVCLGMYSMGQYVVRTIGFGLVSVNFLRGFCIEFASTTAVVVATVLGIPVSTTHCQVGAVVFVGWVAFGTQHVKWAMFGRIALAWIFTVPLSGLLAAGGFLATRSLIVA